MPSFLLLLSGLATLCWAVPEAEVDRAWAEGWRSAASSHNHTQQKTGYRKQNHPLVQEHALRVSAFTHAASRLAHTFDLPIEEAERHLVARATMRQDMNPSSTCLSPFVPASCNSASPYRSIDGSCNNLARPQIGMPFNQLARVLLPRYGDGVGSLRRSVTGNALPSARFVSNTVQDDAIINHVTATHQLPIFGQFVDHDMTSTPEFSPRGCCANRNQPECMPIDVDPSDDFFGPLGQTCLQAQRSIPLCAGSSSTREQVNQATAFIDGSMIYGNSINEMNALRNGIFLQTSGSNNKLPPQDFNNPTCGDPNRNIFCFRAGDARVNENPGLTSMHTLFLREHNRVAQSLRDLNPSWNVEEVWQETRRIVVAEVQQVVYSEYLPVLLGTNLMTQLDLTLPSPGLFSTYDPSIDATTINEFATAAYRFGHTLIRGTPTLAGSPPGNYLLERNFNTPELFYQSSANIDRALFGATQDACQAFDQFIVGALTNHLFQAPNANFGSDLIARNLQRGRDHGLPGYNDYRVACGLNRILTLGDLVDVTGSSSKANRLMTAYNGHIDDIELFVGGISEPPVSGAIVGPTFACIIGEQFKRAKSGDRYFFTHGGQAGSFRSMQLSNIRKRTLGGIMCDTRTANITGLPQNSFLQGQSYIDCSSQQKLSLTGWIKAQ